MSPGALQRLLGRLLAAEGTARDALLDEVSDGDLPLRSVFESLLSEAGSRPGALESGALLDSPLGRQALARLSKDAGSDDGSDRTNPMGAGIVRGRSGEGARVGDVVGSVVLEEELGEGGMGRVFRGFDTKLERPVAVKTVRAESRLDPSVAARFRREATILSRLNHPGICQVYDLLERPEADYLLMEFVEGKTLRERLNEAPSPAERLALARGIVEALAAAHQRGIVHRDLKPDNVMVTPGGLVKVLDFGLARLVDGEREPQAEPRSGSSPERASAGSGPDRVAFRTQMGQTMGTVAYMSPEQAAGEPVTEASDIFSLGLVLQEVFMGRPAYPRVPYEELTPLVASGRTAPLEGLDRDLSRLIRDLLSREPSDRPTAAATAARLGRLAERPARRRRAILAASILLVTAGVGAALVALVRRDPAEECRNTAASMERVWNRGASDALRDAFARARNPQGRDLAERVIARLDAYTGRWSAMRDDACAATHVRGEQSAELLDRRMACLDRSLSRVRAAIAVLGSGEPDVLARSVESVDALPPLSLCADTELLLAPVAPPTDPKSRSALAAVESQLATGFAALDAGRLQAAAEAAAQADASSRALRFRPVQARARYLVGRVRRAEGRFAEARDAFLEALNAAMAGGDQEWVARGLAELVFVTGSDLADLEAAREWQGLGEALLERIGDDSVVAADIYHAAGTVRIWDDPVAARALLERAVRIRRRDLGEGSSETFRSRVNLSNVSFVSGDFAASERWAAEAAESAERELGKDHPYTATALGNVGDARLHAGNAAGAREPFERARAIHAAAKGESSYDTATADINLAVVDLAQGRNRDAQRRAAKALAVFEASLPAGHPYLAYPHLALGRALIGLSRPREAVTHLERALALRKGRPVVLATDIPEVQLALARALWDEGRQRSRAVELARTAAGTLEEIPWAVRLESEADAWLAAHAGGEPHAR